MSDVAVEGGPDTAAETPALADTDALGEAQIAGDVAEPTTAETGAEEGAEAPEAAAEETPQAPERDIQAELEAEWQAEYQRQQFEQQQQLAERIAELTGQQTPQQAQAAPDLAQIIGQLQDEYGNLNPTALLQATAAITQQTVRDVVQQAVSPLQQQMESAQAERAQAERDAYYSELVADMKHDNIARHGEFSSNPEAAKMASDLVESRAIQLLDDLGARYGTNPDGSAKPRVLEAAIEQAANEVRSMLSGHGTGAVTQKQNEIATLAGARSEPGPNGGGGGEAPVIKLGQTSADKFYGG